MLTTTMLVGLTHPATDVTLKKKNHLANCWLTSKTTEIAHKAM